MIQYSPPSLNLEEEEVPFKEEEALPGTPTHPSPTLMITDLLGNRERRNRSPNPPEAEEEEEASSTLPPSMSTRTDAKTSKQRKKKMSNKLRNMLSVKRRINLRK